MYQYRIIQNGDRKIYIKICQKCNEDLDKDSKENYCRKCSGETNSSKLKDFSY